jgi:VDE lipocalin domain
MLFLRGSLAILPFVLFCFDCSQSFLITYPTNNRLSVLQHHGFGQHAADNKTNNLLVRSDHHHHQRPTRISAHQNDHSLVVAPLSKAVPISRTTDVLKSLFVSLCFFSTIIVSPLPSVGYDGFADYAQENKMQQSDISCFINQCGDQTKALGKDLRSLQGVVCLGRCKGEQSCATRCFAEFGGPTLDNWLSCTIEENECVKVPKPDMVAEAAQVSSNSRETTTYQPLQAVVKSFNADTLIGTWYKTNGLNPNYDLFDCQTNTFTKTTANELDMDIRLRISRPGGGFWENELQEHMVLDDPSARTGRTMSTNGKMYGLSFQENWYIVGESDDKIPPFKLVAFQGQYGTKTLSCTPNR